MPLITFRRAALATAVVSLIPVASALAGGTDKVTLDEFSVKASPKTITAGKVKFTAKNAGSDEHELVIIKTKTAASKLKVSGGRAKVSGEVAEIEDVLGNGLQHRLVRGVDPIEHAHRSPPCPRCRSSNRQDRTARQ